MKNFPAYCLILLILLLASCQGNQSKQTSGPDPDSVHMMAVNLFQPLPERADNPDNPITPEKIALGKKLYFDNLLSLKQTQSCNTCHDLAKYGVDNKPTSPGDNGKNGKRNSPTTLNAALHFLQFWDGRMKDVEEQAGGPVMDPDEMGMPDETVVVARLQKSEEYKTMFASAFPGQSNPVTFENMTRAIGAFERTLITPGRFDKFLAGDKSALDTAELRGLKTFMETGCTACHMGSLLGGNMFQKYPLFGTHKEHTGSEVIDEGRFEVTKNEADKNMFKVPSLRNITETWPYFHDGSVQELDKTTSIMAKAELNRDLTPRQVSSMVAFMKALTGEVPK